MGRRPRAGSRPVCHRPHRGHQGPRSPALWLGCHWRRTQPVRQLRAHSPATGQRLALYAHQQRLAGHVGAAAGAQQPAVLAHPPDGHQLCRLPGSDRQHRVLLLPHRAAPPPSAQHGGARTRRQRDTGLRGPPREHVAQDLRFLCQERLLCQCPWAGGASVGHRLRPFRTRHRPAPPAGEPLEGGQPHRLAARTDDARGQPGLSEQPPPRIQRARVARLHAPPGGHAGTAV